jgi:mRNA interferase RelE/StbE
MSTQRYNVTFAPAADRQLRKVPEDVQRRVVRAVELLEDEPRPVGAVKLTGEENLWRIRVGTYRVVYAIDDERLLVVVVRVRHRKDVYRG